MLRIYPKFPLQREEHFQVLILRSPGKQTHSFVHYIDRLLYIQENIKKCWTNAEKVGKRTGTEQWFYEDKFGFITVFN